jgi:hypothetical protein
MVEYCCPVREAICVVIDYLVPLVLFVALMLAAALYGLAVSGHFPGRQKGTAFASAFGAVILFSSVALMIAAVAGGIAAALYFVPWYAAIIGGGFGLLAAPLVLRGFSDRFVDGRGAPLVFAAISLMLLFLLIWLAIGHRCAAGPEVRGLRLDRQTIDLLLHSHCH